MRHIHRTAFARCCATLLLLLAASPVTAPFTTCEVSDFIGDHQPVHVPRPGHQVAVPDTKTNATKHEVACAPPPAFELDPCGQRERVTPTITDPRRRSALQPVLRI